MSQSNHQTSDYISIATVKKSVSETLRLGYRSADFTYFALKKYLWLILFCMALGLGMAYLFSRLKPQYYETEMVLQPNDLPRRAYAEVIYNLNSLITSHSYNGLASELRLQSDEVVALNSLEALSLSDESLAKDTSSRPGLPMKIKVRLRNNDLIPKLQTALLAYLNNISYVKQMRETQKMVFRQKLEFIELEQRRLDSLKENYNRSLASLRLPSTFYNNGLDPADIYKHSLDLASQKQSLVRWLNVDANGIMLIDGLKRPEHPQSLPAWIILLVGVLGGMGLGFLLAMLRALKNWVEKN